MSWGTITVTKTDLAELAGALNDASAAYQSQLEAALEGQDKDAGLSDEAQNQIASGIASAVRLAEGGCFGDGPFTVSLSGHANPGHQATAGYSNDFISVTVSSAAEVPSPASDAAAPVVEAVPGAETTPSADVTGTAAAVDVAAPTAVVEEGNQAAPADVAAPAEPVAEDTSWSGTATS